MQSKTRWPTTSRTTHMCKLSSAKSMWRRPRRRWPRRQVKPDWSLEFAYQQRGPTFSNMISVQVSIDLPLFQENRQNRDLAAKLALVEQARDLREDAVRQHLAEAQAASADWDAATSRLKRFDESLLPAVAASARTRRWPHTEAGAAI